MKIRTTATNRRIRTAGAIMIAFTALTAACGGNTEVLDSAAEADAEVSADVAAETESAEETSSAGATSNSTGQTASASNTNTQTGNAQSSNGSTGGATPAPAPAPAPTPAPAPAPAPAPEQEPEAQQVTPEEQPEQEQVTPEAEAEPEAEEQPEEQPAEPEQEPEQEPEPAPAPIQEFLVDLDYASLVITTDARLTGVTGSSTKGIVSVCAVQYNEYGNPTSGPTGMVTVDGVRYPALLAEGCAPSSSNYGEYTKVWTNGVRRGVNGSLKSYVDVAVRAENGRVRVFCMDINKAAAGFVERNMADFAGRTSLGSCPV